MKAGVTTNQENEETQVATHAHKTAEVLYQTVREIKNKSNEIKLKIAEVGRAPNSAHVKYNIKKKEVVQEQPPEEPINPLMRKKKTPEELAREAEAEEEDEFTKFKNTIETQVNELRSQIESRCSVQ